MIHQLPGDFLLGCATAAHQVEGNLDNDWTRMEREHPERIKDGSVSGIACDHHARYRDDLRELADMHHSAHRFSIEWSRVEPRDGVFDADELRHYADVVRTCRSLRMEPVVTLHHFTLPVWLADRGGVCSSDAPHRFARFAAVCAEAIGADVRWWITINEPTVLAVFGYLYGEWPPLEPSMGGFLDALAGMARMHAAGYTALHRVAHAHGWDAAVSIAHHERPLRPLNPRSPIHRAVAVLPNAIFNRWFLRACTTGRLLPPVGHSQVVPGLRGSLDYLGLNFYCEERVRFSPRRPRELFAENVVPSGVPLSAFGWTIDPDALRRAIENLWEDFRLPILITENGVADDHDELRAQFIVDHLSAVGAAIAAGADVRGYLHWTAMDNFEWAEGYSKRFGLLAVDRGTQERTPKPSAAVFAQICASRRVGVPQAPVEAAV
ncbi:MAG: glycoside hydrolase family 1 protein [Candidatus Dormibacteraeota bacterium]|uniref:Glycoside hydrolase family 1 protein n=1 Tax=Candidatus Aeolococcus gillhamiae TaxID=3127015 RepID=A0A934MZV8_9BACT|nr:glycoside hydrolase family 1 protein [Candidatus Dormibacteraeota bacterium]